MCPTTAGDAREYLCAGGAHHLVAPIVLGERRAALLVLGPFLYYPPTRDDAIKQAHQLGLDGDVLFEAYKGIPVASGRRTDELAHLLGSASLLVSEYLDMARRNLELREQMEQRNRQLAALADIGSLVLNADNVEGTFRELVDRICRATGTSFGLIGRLDSGARQLSILATHGIPADVSSQTGYAPIRLGQCQLLRNALDSRSIVVEVPSKEPSASEIDKFFCKTYGLRMLLAAPITLNNDTVGAVILGSGRARSLSAEDLSVVSALSTQVAIATKNATTYAEQIEARRRAVFLAEAGRLLNSTVEPNEVLQQITEKATDVLGECCIIAMRQGASDEIDFEVFHHRDERKHKILARAVKTHPLHVGEALSGRVILTGEPTLINNAGEDYYPHTHRPYIRELAMRSAVGAPIGAKGDTTGAVVLTESRPGREFTEDDLSFVVTLAQQLTVAIERASLYSAAETEHQKLATVISGMADGVMILDEEGRVLSINRAGSDILAPIVPGTSLEELNELIQPCHAGAEPTPPDQLPIPKVLATGVAVVNAEVEVSCPDGDRRTVQMSAAPVYDRDGVGSGVVAVFRDVTATKQMDRLKDEFISVVSHELRAPLATISGYAQMLTKQLSLREGLDQELDELQLIKVCTHQLSTLVRDLLDVTRHESGSLRLNLRPVSLTNSLRAVAARLEHLSHNHHLVVHSAARLPLVLADERRVEQILSNLISNAIKFSPDGGEVLISTQLHEDHVVVSIRDHGIGISKYDLNRLFDRFYRVDNTEGRPFEGIGLGLHVSKILVEAQAGRIWARSQRGHGSVFSFWLPLYGGESAESSSC